MHRFDDLGIACGILQTKVLRHKSRTGALDFVRAGFHCFAEQRLGDDRRILGFNRDGRERRLEGFDELVATGDGSTRADR